MKNIPNKIFLQVGGDVDGDADFNDLDLDEVTHCVDRIYPTDIEYVRRDCVEYLDRERNFVKILEYTTMNPKESYVVGGKCNDGGFMRQYRVFTTRASAVRASKRCRAEYPYKGCPWNAYTLSEWCKLVGSDALIDTCCKMQSKK